MFVLQGCFFFVIIHFLLLYPSHVRQWPLRHKLRRYTHFSKTAHPKTVPNTETGRTYLLMTPETR